MGNAKDGKSYGWFWLPKPITKPKVPKVMPDKKEKPRIFPPRLANGQWFKPLPPPMKPTKPKAHNPSTCKHVYCGSCGVKNRMPNPFE